MTVIFFKRILLPASTPSSISVVAGAVSPGAGFLSSSFTFFIAYAIAFTGLVRQSFMLACITHYARPHASRATSHPHAIAAYSRILPTRRAPAHALYQRGRCFSLPAAAFTRPTRLPSPRAPLTSPASRTPPCSLPSAPAERIAPSSLHTGVTDLTLGSGDRVTRPQSRGRRDRRHPARL
jgi:hypothetical protein